MEPVGSSLSPFGVLQLRGEPIEESEDMNQHTKAHDDAPLNIQEAAHRLGVSVRYMRRMVDERRVRYLKVGRLVRFRGPDLEAFLKQAEVEPVVPVPGRINPMLESR